MFKRSPAPFVPPIPPDVTSSSESSPVLRQQQLPDQGALGALGRPQHPGMVPPGTPAMYGHFAGLAEYQDYQDYPDMNMMMMQRWQQQQGAAAGGGGRRPNPAQAAAAAMMSPGRPGREPPSAGLPGGGRPPYYGGPASFGYAAANAAPQAPAGYGYGFSPYAQPSPYSYPAPGGGFPFGAGMYGAPAGYGSPYMTPMATPGLLDPIGAVAQPMGAAAHQLTVPGQGTSMIGRPGAQTVHEVTGKWLAGTEYAPALDHLLFTIVKPPVVELHPLLRSISETRDSSDAFLVFDILFPPNTIHLSTEPPRKSWSKGRKDPATFPRLKLLRIVTKFTPWVIQVSTDSAAGLTVSDVVLAIHEHYRINASQDDDWGTCDPAQQSEILMAYKWNRSTEMGAPGGIMPDALLRGDFLMERTMFAGMKVADDDLCEQKMHIKGFPATFELSLHTR